MQDVKAPLSIQPFDNSAMDGFAIRIEDLKKATKDAPVTLKKSGIIAAGDPVSTKQLKSRTCIQIMTGAPVPKGADAVVPIEHVELHGDDVLFKDKPKEHANIRFAGEDFKKSDVLLKAGDRLGAAHILPLATLGIHQFQVYKKPRVAFMATGRELVDDFSTPLKSGQIYNSNRPYALAFLESLGCELKSCETVQDDPKDFSDKLSCIMKNDVDIAISSGAVSAGEFDFVKAGLEKIGAEILYHKIKLKPGKPNLLARLPNGTLYFGLPGNPVASAVGLRFLVVAAIRAMLGQDIEQPLHARAMSKFSKKAGLHMILKGRSESWEDGSLTVDILDGQASFMVSPFLKMDSWIHVPEGLDEVKAGDCMSVYPLIPNA